MVPVGGVATFGTGHYYDFCQTCGVGLYLYLATSPVECLF